MPLTMPYLCDSVHKAVICIGALVRAWQPLKTRVPGDPLGHSEL